MELLVIPLVLAIGAFYLTVRSETVNGKSQPTDNRKLHSKLILTECQIWLLKESLRVSETQKCGMCADTDAYSIARIGCKTKGNGVTFSLRVWTYISTHG